MSLIENSVLTNIEPQFSAEAADEREPLAELDMNIQSQQDEDPCAKETEEIIQEEDDNCSNSKKSGKRSQNVG
jgi:hypothetical protein